LAVGESTLPAYSHLEPLAAGGSVICLDELLPPPARRERAFAARLAAALPVTWAAALRPFDPRAWDADDHEAMAASVERTLGEDGLAAALCGLGPDGHVAFNQPPDPGDSRTRTVRLAPANLARLGDVAPATGAFTLGLGTVRAAQRLGLVVAGHSKTTALDRLLSGPAGPDYPVSWLRDHPALAVFVSRPCQGRSSRS
jgi:glucosamine-6-phosphate deaminase